MTHRLQINTRQESHLIDEGENISKWLCILILSSLIGYDQIQPIKQNIEINPKLIKATIHETAPPKANLDPSQPQREKPNEVLIQKESTKWFTRQQSQQKNRWSRRLASILSANLAQLSEYADVSIQTDQQQGLQVRIEFDAMETISKQKMTTKDLYPWLKELPLTLQAVPYQIRIHTLYQLQPTQSLSTYYQTLEQIKNKGPFIDMIGIQFHQLNANRLVFEFYLDEPRQN